MLRIPRLGFRRYGIFLLATAAVYASGKNRIRSGDYPNKSERIAVLVKYVRMRSAIQDAEYDIYDVNIGAESSIPGPTHRDFKIALSLKRGDAKKWLSDVVVTSFPQDMSWCQALIQGKDNFKLRHPQDFWTYTGKAKTAFFFEKDGVLCIRISQE